jgi:hypothetical protein
MQAASNIDSKGRLLIRVSLVRAQVEEPISKPLTAMLVVFFRSAILVPLRKIYKNSFLLYHAGTNRGQYE